MVEGFTIKCNKCGKELTFTNEYMKDAEIRFGTDITYEMPYIQCDCGNEIDQE